MQTNILVIDDSETIHKVIRLAFHQLNARIIDCHSLAQAANLFETGIENQKPDIVLADASLPGGGDSEAAEAYSLLQASLDKVPFLILIGSYDSVDEASFEHVGLRNFIKKPFDSRDLVDKVSSLLGYQLSPKHIDSAAMTKPNTFSLDENKPPIPVVENNSGETRMRSSKIVINIPPPPKPKEQAEPESNRQGHIAPIVPPPPATMTSKSPSFSPITGSGERVTSGFSLASEQVGTAVGAYPVNDKTDLPEEQFGEIAPDGTTQFPYRDSGDEYAFTSGHSSSDKKDIEKHKQSIGMADSMLSDLLKDDLRSMVKAAVFEYCDQHFKGLAKEVITQEIQKLTELKSRLLIDN